VAPTGTPPPKPTGPSPAPPPLRPATVQLRPPIVQKSPTAGEKPAPGAGGEAEIRITTEGPPLSSREVERIKYCLRLISPRPPYSARLVPIGGTLYLADEQATSQVIWRSRDFRDCLKNEIQGNIGAKTVIIQGIVKGKAAP
jgi:hypothetical protein